MKKKLLITISIISALALLGTTFISNNRSAPGDCDTSKYVFDFTQYLDGDLEFRQQICFETDSGNLINNLWIGTNSKITTQASVQDLNRYTSGNILDSVINSENLLDSDVEIGKRWVQILREWSDESANLDWAAMTSNAQNQVMQKLLDRISKTWEGLAALLVTLGY